MSKVSALKDLLMISGKVCIVFSEIKDAVGLDHLECLVGSSFYQSAELDIELPINAIDTKITAIYEMLREGIKCVYFLLEIQNAAYYDISMELLKTLKHVYEAKCTLLDPTVKPKTVIETIKKCDNRLTTFQKRVYQLVKQAIKGK